MLSDSNECSCRGVVVPAREDDPAAKVAADAKPVLEALEHELHQSQRRCEALAERLNRLEQQVSLIANFVQRCVHRHEAKLMPSGEIAAGPDV